MAKVFDDDEHHGNEEDADDGRNGRTEDDGDPHVDTGCGTGTGGHGQRDGADNEGQGRHDDRAQTDLGGFNSSRHGIHAALIDTDFGVFDDQDGVLGSQADDGQDTDLEVDVVLLAQEVGKDGCPKDTGRQTE